MLREGWNFHNDIAIPLESIASCFFGDLNRPFDKIYNADSIESGYFVECMIELVRNKSNYVIGEETDDFIREASRYFGLKSNEINKEEAQRLFDRFAEIFEKM